MVSQNLHGFSRTNVSCRARITNGTVLDPATLQSAKVLIDMSRDRSVVRANDTILPAFHVDMAFGGLQTTSWVTDTGEVVREESRLG